MKVTWKNADGTSISAEVAPGVSLMEAAIANNVPHITGDCGGNLACATCHVFVDADWSEKIGPPEDMEDGMLDITAVERTQHSRLSCQIIASEDLDGLVLHMPA
ncbi:MAG: ferredoxin [Rhodobacteraceae bacterium]|jgi:2Fe-2S ferredoxin|nr:ferredoxin [Paracoccaceae bacterium]